MSKVSTNDRANFFTVASAGATRKLTPEGYLLCEGVAIGRTGVQLYSSKELGLPAGSPAVIRVTRQPEEVFSDATLASFEGKPVTLNHPAEGFVTPENWQSLAVGTVQNVRRGVGTKDDLMLADLLITAADAIVYVNDNLPELSSGYEAEYVELGQDVYNQQGILGNHVAIMVNMRGRAGSRCSIKDEGFTVFKDIWERIKNAVATQDKAAVETALAELNADPNATALAAVAGLTTKLATTDSAVAELTRVVKDLSEKLAAQTVAVPTSDTALKYDAALLPSIQSQVEILAPGTRLPVADAATVEAVETVVRTAITATQAKNPKDVNAFLMGRDVKAITGDDLRGLLNGVSEVIKLRNDVDQLNARARTQDKAKTPNTPAELNIVFSDFWNKKSA